MSTASSDMSPNGGTAMPIGGTPRPVDESSTVAALVLQTGAFTDAFGRWASHKAAEAGASVPRLRLLYAVMCHGPQKMADLADELTVTPRNVTALVDGLEGEGLVRRVPHSTDRRITLVELTCSPDRVAAQFQTYQASIERLFDVLTVDDQRTLLRLLATLRDRLLVETGCSIPSGEASDA